MYNVKLLYVHHNECYVLKYFEAASLRNKASTKFLQSVSNFI